MLPDVGLNRAYMSDPAGNSGNRIACGVISESYRWPLVGALAPRRTFVIAVLATGCRTGQPLGLWPVAAEALHQGRLLREADSFTLTPGPRKTGTDSFRNYLASCGFASKFHALILGELSRSLRQKLRLSEMVLIDRLAFCIRAVYPTISRCTRAASFCSVSLNICSSAMSFSISCTEVPDTCCSSEPILPAASSLALCCGTRGAVALRETTSRISPSSFEKTSTASLACVRSRDRSELMFNAPD